MSNTHIPMAGNWALASSGLGGGSTSDNTRRPSKEIAMYPPLIAAELERLKSVPGARLRRQGLRRMQLRWQADLFRLIEERGGTLRVRDSRDRLMSRFRTRAELAAIHERAHRELTTGRGTPHSFLDLVATSESASQLHDLQDLGMGLLADDEALEKFCERTDRNPGFYSAEAGAELQGRAERALLKFPRQEQLERPFVSQIAEAIPRETFFQVRMQELDRGLGLTDPNREGLVRATREAFDALMLPTTLAVLKDASGRMAQALSLSRAEEQSAAVRSRERSRAEQIRQKVRQGSLLRMPPDGHGFSTERSQQLAVCEAFVAWRWVQSDMAAADWGPLRSALDQIPSDGGSWPFAEELVRARQRMEGEAKDVLKELLDHQENDFESWPAGCTDEQGALTNELLNISALE